MAEYMELGNILVKYAIKWFNFLSVYRYWSSSQDNLQTFTRSTMLNTISLMVFLVMCTRNPIIFGSTQGLGICDGDFSLD